MPLPHSIASALPSSSSAWWVHSSCWWHAHVWHGLEIPDYPDIKVLAWKGDPGAKDMLTNSTNPTIHLCYLSRLDHPRSLEHSCKIAQYLWRCQSYRRLRRTTMQSGAATWSGVWCRNRVISKCTCVAIYTREAVVTWVIPCIQAFLDLVAFTSGRGEDMFVCPFTPK